MPSAFKFIIVCALVSIAIVTTNAVESPSFVFDHLSLNVTDPMKATEWYVSHLGGVADGDSAVRFGGVRLSFRKAAEAPPSSGSVIDHLAFASAAMAAGFSTDPWGTRIEIVSGHAGQTLHHVHLLATDPSAMLNWLTKSFGGERANVDGLNAARFGTVLVAVDRSEREPAPSAGRVIDHLGWATPNVDASAATLKSAGVTFTIEPRTAGNLRMAFVEGPNRLRVEIVQR
jgi:catechol 2,3-dioxygenase-like lactoylglutathione lyase family enzyme